VDVFCQLDELDGWYIFIQLSGRIPFMVEPCNPTAKCLPSADQLMLLIDESLGALAAGSTMNTGFQVAVSHILSGLFLSAEPVATYLPSGDHDTTFTPPPKPVSLATDCPAATSHTITVVSDEPETKN
jgi:hypothetical protein